MLCWKEACFSFMLSVNVYFCILFSGSRWGWMVLACSCLWFILEHLWTCSPHIWTSFLPSSSSEYSVPVRLLKQPQWLYKHNVTNLAFAIHKTFYFCFTTTYSSSNLIKVYNIFPFVCLCVGVWHNFMLCVVALSFLFLLPILLFPLYYTGAGALVTEVVEVRSTFIFKFYV